MPRPQQLDFAALADGIVRNNVGVDGITLAVRARIDGHDVVIEGTGQRLPATATAEPSAAQPWLWCEVEGYDEGAVTLRCLDASSGPDARPQVLPVDR